MIRNKWCSSMHTSANFLCEQAERQSANRKHVDLCSRSGREVRALWREHHLVTCPRPAPCTTVFLFGHRGHSTQLSTVPPCDLFLYTLMPVRSSYILLSSA